MNTLSQCPPNTHKVSSRLRFAFRRLVITKFNPLLLSAVTILFATAAAASELNIEDYRWNVDGVGRHGMFNQVTVLVTNVSASDFDGTLDFLQGGSVSPTREYRQPLFLGKGQTTRVVFDCFLGSYAEGGVLRWGKGDKRTFDVIAPTCIWPSREIDYEKDPLSLPPVVWIESGLESAPAAGGALRPLPSRWFPVTAATLPADGVVALSRDPEFQPAQRQALADWVRLGGTVYVFPNGDQYDQFTGELAFLNLNKPRQAVGRGVVFHDDRKAGDLNTKQWRSISQSIPRDRFTAANGGLQQQQGYAMDHLQVNFSDSVYEVLSIIHQPKVYWPLIFLLFFVYIASIIAGGIVVSRKTRDWKATYLTLALLIGMFSGLFWFVGARGHGEATEATTLAIADVVETPKAAATEGQSRARIRGWTQYFTTSSGRFDLRPLDGRLGIRPREYSRGSLIVDGPTGVLQKRIPVYSAASYEWQGLTDVSAPVVKKAVLYGTGLNSQIDVKLEGLGPNSSIRILRGNRIASMSNVDGTYQTSRWSSQSPFLALEPQAYELKSRFENFDDRNFLRGQVVESLEKWVSQYSRTTEAGVLSAEDDVGVLLVFDDLPDELATRYDGAAHYGRILYRIPITFEMLGDKAALNAKSPPLPPVKQTTLPSLNHHQRRS